MRYEGGLDQDRSSRGDDKWLDLDLFEGRAHTKEISYKSPPTAEYEELEKAKTHIMELLKVKRKS